MGHCAEKIVVGTLNEHAGGGGVPCVSVTYLQLK